MTKTLAQMTENERETCIGMWVNTPLGYGVLVDHLSMIGYHEPVVLIASCAKLCDGRWDWDQLDLRPEMPRAWEPNGIPPNEVVMAAKDLRLPSLVYGETYPYAWAAYQGNIPIKRFIDKDAALDYFTKLVEEKQEATE